jgi:iron complex outermembrane receptor protein
LLIDNDFWVSQVAMTGALGQHRKPVAHGVAMRSGIAGLALTLVTFGEVSAQQAAGEAAQLPPVVVTAPAKPSASKPKRANRGLSKTQPQRAAPQPKAAPQPVASVPSAEAAVIPTTAGSVQGYRALTAVSATNVATPISDLPQSLQVVPRSVLDDQTVISVDEALQNVSGVTGTNRLQTPAYDSILIRGFAAEQWRDGMPVLYNPGHRDAMAHVERIEVIKGPQAILYSGGAGAPTGGAVNVVSKLPYDTAARVAGVTVGSHDFVRSFIDVNQPLTAEGSVLFRMIGEYGQAGSFIDAIETDTYAISPTLVFTDKADTTFTLQGHVTRWQAPEYQGLPATGTVAGGFRIDPDLFIGPANIPDSFSELQSVTGTLDHRFSKATAATVKVRWRTSQFAELAQSLIGADGLQANIPAIGPSTWLLTNGMLQQAQRELSVTANARTGFGWLGARHTLLLGGDISRVDDDVGLFVDGVVGQVDLDNPQFTTPFARPPRNPATTFIDTNGVYKTQAAVAQLQTDIGDRVHLLAALRLADLRIDALENVAGEQISTGATRLLPRLGALVDLTPWLSAYGSYGEGMQGHYLAGYRGVPEPEFSRQYEAGLKFELAGGLTGTLAVFDIERTDVPVTDFNLVPVGTSSERSRGFEADVLWQPDANWKILGAYAFVDTELLEANRVAPPGVRRVGVPEHTGRLWVNYAFDPHVLKGVSVGAGLYAASDAAIDLGNVFFTDPYLTVDAAVTYAADRWKATASVKNLTDELYFVPHNYLGGRVARGDARSIYLTVTNAF